MVFLTIRYDCDINGRLEYFSGTYFDLVLMGVQFHVIENTLVVLIFI